MSGLMSIGLSALDAAQAGMTTTSENIANVNTTGYSDESTVQAAATTVFTGSGYIGQGVGVETVTRAYNSFQQQQVVAAQSSSSALNAQYSQMEQIDNMLGDPTTGLGSEISSFFSSAQTVANSPSDSSARTALLDSAQTVSATFNSVAQQLQQLGSSTSETISQDVSSANSYAQQIATLNQQIVSAQATGQPPNTLLDARDALVQEVNSEVGATAITQSNGAVDLYVGNGQPLVTGSTANALQVVSSTSDPNQLELAIKDGASTTRLASGQLQGGNITGLLAFNNGALQTTQNAVGQIAIGLASAVNTQNEMGQDANGKPGQVIFSVPSPIVTAASTNSATAAVSATITKASQLTSSNYQLSYNGSQYALTRLSDGTVSNFSSMPQTVDGVTFALTSPMAAGDSFTIAPTAAGASGIGVIATDPSSIAAASPVRASTGASNTGDVAQTALSVIAAPPLSSTVQDPVQITFQVTGSTVTYNAVDQTTGTALATGAPYTAGAPITLNGWSLTLNGTPAAGDSVSVGANDDGTGDNSNALLLAGLANGSVTTAGSAATAYADLVGSIGSQTSQLQSTSTAQASILSDATTAQSSTSGVNLDDEAANLLKYQQAYQAASQTIATAQSMFTAIMDLFTQ